MDRKAFIETHILTQGETPTSSVVGREEKTEEEEEGARAEEEEAARSKEEEIEIEAERTMEEIEA